MVNVLLNMSCRAVIDHISFTAEKVDLIAQISESLLADTKPLNLIGRAHFLKK